MPRLLLIVSLVLCGAVIAACGGAVTQPPALTLIAPQDLPTASFDDPVLREGQFNYDLYCAHCHGYDGQGQVEESIANTVALGMHLVPAHNATGHTYQHPDQLLLRVVKEGIPNPHSQYPMPPFGQVLTDEQIMGIYAYIKLWWTDDQRRHQAEVSARWDEIGRALGSGVESTDTIEENE